MELQLSAELETAIHQLGYASVNEFAEKNVKREIQEKIAEYQLLVDSFEKKYGMNYEEFSNRVVDKTDPVLKNFGVIEKEDDDFAWEDAIEMVEHYSLSII